MEDTVMPRLVDALDALEDGVYIIDCNFVIQYMNKAMVSLFGEGVRKKCYTVINQGEAICPWCRAEQVFDLKETCYGEVALPRVGRYFHITAISVTSRNGMNSQLVIYRDITRTKVQEARLKSSEEDYRRLFNHVGCGVFTSSKQGRFLDVNPALLSMLGYDDKEEFLDLDLATQVYLDPKHRTAYQTIIEKEGKVVDYEVEWKRRDGSIIPVLLTTHLRYNIEKRVLGYEGIVVDCSQRKKIENRMKEALDFLDKIITCSPDAIMATDLKGEVLIWNQGAEETFGYRSEEVIGKKKITEIYPNGVAQEMMQKLRFDDYGGRGKLKSYPMTVQHRDGHMIEGSLSASIIYDDRGKEIASVGIFVDLGERLRMERKLSETRQHLLQSEKLAAMGRLTSQIAHELNNPLFGIMNTLELMKTEISPENKRRRLLDMSLSETERLADMLKKMLSFSTPDQVKRSNISINIVLEEILLLYGKRFRENSIKVTTRFMEFPGLVYASKDQLRQVFLNMFSNAMDAMPDGGVLSISTDQKDQTVLIVIADTGIGIEEENLERIFESFFTTKTDNVKGVGLGLSVCYGFIKDHGGEISVKSTPYRGTVFTISLPVAGGI